MKNKLIKAFSILMSVTLMFNVAFALSSSAATTSELEDQIADIQEERENQQAILDELKDDVDRQAEYVATLYSQIDTLQTEIDLYQVKINELNGEVAALNVKIEEKNRRNQRG